MKRCFVLLLLAISCSFASNAQDINAMKDSLNDLLRKSYYFKNKIKYEAAINTSEEAYKIAHKLDNVNDRVDSFIILTLINLEFEEFNSADFYLNRAENILKNTEYDYGFIISKGLRAILQSEKKQFYEALNTIRDAKETINRKDKKLLNLIAYYEGIVHFKRNDFEKAKNIFEKLNPIDHPYEKNYLRATLHTYLSKVYYNENNYEKATEKASGALKIANSIDFPRLKMANNRMLANLYQKNEDYQKALYHSEKADEIIHLVLNPQSIQRRDPFIENSTLAFQARLISQLERENNTQQQQVNMSKLTSVLSSALLIIISLLTISLYRNNQIKFKTNDLLLKKNSELENARDEAERAMQAKAQFLSTVSHELRTPLYAVTGLTHLLLEENPSESQKEHLKSLKFSGEYLLNFINDILQINKIEAKKLSLQKIPFSLKTILNDVVDTLSQTAKENNNTIELSISKELPTELIGDPLKLSQILINLIGNACKFTENGVINVIADTIVKEDKNATIRFKIKDNGIGISEELQATIFESFAQGSIQINRKYGGTGLGLTIVKSLLSLFDSEIKLDSELGLGSTFIFDINFEVTKQEVIVPLDTKISVKDEFFQDMHLLIVEDNKINQVITKKMLLKKGMTCDIANDGYEAIEMAKSPIYNAILMDIHMPGISGLLTTKEIRKFNTKVPIIALTAMSLDENTDDLYKVGCNDVITKPFKPELFYKKLGTNILRNIEVNI